jgi:hypothetical protein
MSGERGTAGNAEWVALHDYSWGEGGRPRSGKELIENLVDLICNAQRRVSTRPSHAPASSEKNIIRRPWRRIPCLICRGGPHAAALDKPPSGPPPVTAPAGLTALLVEHVLQMGQEQSQHPLPPTRPHNKRCSHVQDASPRCQHSLAVRVRAGPHMSSSSEPPLINIARVVDLSSSSHRHGLIVTTSHLWRARGTPTALSLVYCVLHTRPLETAHPCGQQPAAPAIMVARVDTALLGPHGRAEGICQQTSWSPSSVCLTGGQYTGGTACARRWGEEGADDPPLGWRGAQLEGVRSAPPHHCKQAAYHPAGRSLSMRPSRPGGAGTRRLVLPRGRGAAGWVPVPSGACRNADESRGGSRWGSRQAGRQAAHTGQPRAPPYPPGPSPVPRSLRARARGWVGAKDSALVHMKAARHSGPPLPPPLC